MEEYDGEVPGLFDLILEQRPLALVRDIPTNAIRERLDFGDDMRLLRYVTLGACALAAALGACLPGPDNIPPAGPIAPHYSELSRPLSAAGPFSEDTVDLSAWWQGFHDPCLAELIAAAINFNVPLESAGARVREARALEMLARSRLFPVVGANVEYSRERLSETGLALAPPPNPPTAFDWSNSSNSARSGRQTTTSNSTSAGSAFNLLPEFDLYQVGLDASWELDLFGRYRRRIDAAAARTAAAEENRRSTLVSLIGEVARSYCDLRSLQSQRETAEKNLRAQRSILELAGSRARTGLSPELDLIRARAQEAATAAEIPVLESREEQARHRLSVLVGREPGDLDARLTVVAPPPAAPAEVYVGIPSDLLRRRPDVRAAERQLAAAVAELGGAVADLYPRLVLTGTFSFASGKPSQLFDWKSRQLSVGPVLNVPLFDGGALTAVVYGQSARLDQALLSYQQTLLTALEEVDDGIAGVAASRREQALREAIVRDQQNSLRLALAAYRAGMSDFLTVLDAERSLYGAEEALVQARHTLLTGVVALYKALGGGWSAGQDEGGRYG
jgi:outer membrane protein, multidrug efflux system